MHEAAAANGSAVAQRLLERVEHEARMRRARGAPADDPPCEGVDEEGDMDEAGSSGDMSEIGHPQRVRPRRPELPIDLVLRARDRIVAHRRKNFFLQAHCRASTAPPCDAPSSLPPGSTAARPCARRRPRDSRRISVGSSRKAWRRASPAARACPDRAAPPHAPNRSTG